MLTETYRLKLNTSLTVGQLFDKILLYYGCRENIVIIDLNFVQSNLFLYVSTAKIYFHETTLENIK